MKYGPSLQWKALRAMKNNKIEGQLDYMHWYGMISKIHC